MTARRSMKKRMRVIPSSRTRMTIVTHHHSRPATDSRMKADSVSALSAIGSAILPKLVMSPRERASCPSRRSVIEAMMKTSVAASLIPSRGCSMSQTKTGTSARRRTVSALAILTSGACPVWGAAPEGLLEVLIPLITHSLACACDFPSLPLRARPRRPTHLPQGCLPQGFLPRGPFLGLPAAPRPLRPARGRGARRLHLPLPHPPGDDGARCPAALLSRR
ncbi:MAG: hypothetical protein Q605_AUC00811G0003 [Actinomyces urogenitalis DORA_12]|uniref:Uncharacterized protein n=1 Tax=Actinomyces urogenitalis DORA_12 TaxID=1403939 RepID=W1VD51_9ACTO|nr:MAG: hypothetical protein Q605_AUC00811G0003 [Actinomyces urogenitalis DORA_12]